jgi:initiation factor 1A
MSYKDEDPRANQHYAKITKIFGHGHVQVTYHGNSVDKDWQNEPGSVRLREIRANVRQRRGLNKLKVQNGSIAIISLRDFEPGTADVLHVYRDDEVKILRRRQELPSELDHGSRSEDSETFFSELVEEDDVTVSYRNDQVDQYGIPIEDDIDSDSDSDSD